MSKSPSITQKPALDMIDEAITLARNCPPAIGALYYIGAVPFVLAFLYFWTDMSRGAFAQEHLVRFSFFVAIGFCWCKFWQCLFATHLLAVAMKRPLPPWSPYGLVRIATTQASLQATGLFIIPIAALITLPYAAACAFYQNAAILAMNGRGAAQETAALRKEALAEARRWPAQNNIGLAILYLFWLVVFFNVFILIITLPWLLKTLLGVDTMFSRSLFSMFNTTVIVATGGITYLCVDPIIKAFYVIRCFHGRALSTGEDLQIKIRAVTPARFPTIAAIALLFFVTIARGADATAPAVAARIDQSIADALNRPEFAWRAPREGPDPSEGGGVDGFMMGAVKMIGNWLRPLKHWIIDIFDWISEHSHPQPIEEKTSGGDSWRGSLQFFAWAFCAAAVCALVVIGWKLWLRRGAHVEVIAKSNQLTPDLNAEDLTADQLPEDAWLGLAREMIDKGDLRLALRAFYLAALAHLGERHIISIARYKSNYDYQRELCRRRPTQTGLITAFTDAVRSFERAWYGNYEVNPEILDTSRINLERIRES